MQPTNARYKTIVNGDHWFETQVTFIRGDSEHTPEVLGENYILSCKITRPGMPENKPSIGGALSAMLDLTIVNPPHTIPKMAQFLVEFRATNRATPETAVTSTNTSEWYPSGTFYVDTRSKTEGAFPTITLTAYDAMMKAEQDYSTTALDWPATDKNVVAEIASAIGVSVDSRTNRFLTAGHKINLPTDYSMREVLEHIAGMNGGNFIITPENKLLFVPLYGLNPEENLTGTYLKVEGSTDAITFGNEGWYILV